MTTVEAPGKLFIAGEYAVTVPGEAAVLVAVDRLVRVTVSDAEETGSIHSSHFAGPRRWQVDERGQVAFSDARPRDYVGEALRLTMELVTVPKPLTITIESELDGTDGRKFGLGSSGAVTVGIIGALDAHYGLGLSPEQRVKLAILVTLSIAPRASGADVATSTLGGWVHYRAPDHERVLRVFRRDGVRAALDAAWGGFAVRPIPAPASVQLHVGWTGTPVQTSTMVASLDRSGTAFARFTAENADRVGRLVRGLLDDDAASILNSILETRAALKRLQVETGVEIETDLLARLCDRAVAIGAAGKPSGAGGGDCGIVIAPRALDVSRMLSDWKDDGIVHLPIAVYGGERT